MDKSIEMKKALLEQLMKAAMSQGLQGMAMPEAEIKIKVCSPEAESEDEGEMEYETEEAPLDEKTKRLMKLKKLAAEK